MKKTILLALLLSSCSGATAADIDADSGDGRRVFGEYETACDTAADCVLAWTAERACGACPDGAINSVSQADMLDDLESVQGNCVATADHCDANARAVCAFSVCTVARVFFRE